MTFQASRHPEYRERYAHMLLALAFVPVADVPDAFDQLRRKCPEALHTVYNGFEEYFISGKPAKIQPALWNPIPDRHRYIVTVPTTFRKGGITASRSLVVNITPIYIPQLRRYKKNKAIWKHA